MTLIGMMLCAYSCCTGLGYYTLSLDRLSALVCGWCTGHRSSSQGDGIRRDRSEARLASQWCDHRSGE